MKRVRYTGDPSVRVGSKLIERGGEVDVDDLTGAALCQSSSWEAVTKKNFKAKKDD